MIIIVINIIIIIIFHIISKVIMSCYFGEWRRLNGWLVYVYEIDEEGNRKRNGEEEVYN
jgi:hypothetical protein